MNHHGLKDGGTRTNEFRPEVGPQAFERVHLLGVRYCVHSTSVVFLIRPASGGYFTSGDEDNDFIYIAVCRSL